MSELALLVRALERRRAEARADVERLRGREIADIAAAADGGPPLWRKHWLPRFEAERRLAALKALEQAFRA